MSARIYVGNLPLDIRESELDDLFYKYGRIREIELKTPGRPPAFAFITFDDHRDAEDAVRGRDGYNFDGYRIRVEFAKGDRRGGRDDRDRDRRDDRDRREDRRDGRKGGRRTEYGIVISNLPRGCSWQDLKDFARKVGDVVYTDCGRDGEGVVEFSNRQDMEHAVRTLDDTEFKNFSETSRIRVRFASKQSGGDDDRREDKGSSSKRDASVSRSRSRSRSPGRKRSPRSHSRSPSGERRHDNGRDEKNGHDSEAAAQETSARDD